VRLYYTLMAESAALVPEIRPAFVRANRDFRALVERWIEDGIEAGEIRRDVEPSARAAGVVGTLRGLALQWLVDPDGFDAAAVRTDLRASLEAALAR
jgi:hypothetical protein